MFLEAILNTKSTWHWQPLSAGYRTIRVKWAEVGYGTANCNHGALLVMWVPE